MKKIFAITLFILMLLCIERVNGMQLEEGDYYIRSALDNNLVLNISTGTIDNGSNIELYSWNETDSQVWHVRPISQNHYYITSKLSNDKSLDVAGGSKKNGANIQLYEYNGSDAQIWELIITNDGYYYIKSKISGLSMDVSGGRKISGANIQVYENNNSAAQKFKFEKIGSNVTIEEGDYYIRSALDNNLVLNISTGTIDNGSNIELYSWNETDSQVWHVRPISQNHYYITSKLSNDKSLDVAGGSKKNGANIQLYEYNGSDAQIWELIITNDGYYYIKSEISGLNMDVSGGRKINGANIQVYENNNSAAQKFKFEKIGSNATIEEGDYYIRSALDNNLVLNISAGTIDNGSNIELYSWNETDSQVWHVKPISQNHYYITSKLSNDKSLDVAGGSKKNGANIQLYEYNGSDAQIWELIITNDGYYYIKSKISGLNMDVSGGRKINGANIQVYENNNSAAQKFKFDVIKKTEINDGEQGESVETTLIYNDIDINDGYYKISPSLNNDMMIDLSNGSKANGTNIQVASRTSNLSQVWYIKRQDDGSYSITSALNRNTAFDILNGGLTAKNNIQLYRYNDIDIQKWYIRDTEDGNVTFVSKAGDFAIDLDSLNIGDGSNVVINNLSYSETQKFKLEPYTDTKIYKGIDVSSHNGTINWGEVANEVDFAIIRLGYGGGEDGRDDTNFIDNVRGCEEYNIPYGVYLYSYALNSDIDTTVEIEHARNLLSGINPNLGTKVFFDMEDADNWKKRHGVYDDNVLLNTITDKFCAGVESYGYSCGIYANVDWLTNKLDAVSLANKYTIWVAIWPDNSTINNFSTAYNMRPAYNLTSYNYWQFTSNGYINGINGTVDLNLGYDIFD